MKRLFTLALAIILMLSITVSANAAQFVESITNKGAPDLIIIDQINGKDVVGFITNPDGDKVSTEFIDCFEFYPLVDALTDSDIPENIKEELKKVYEELTKSDVDLEDVCPELADIVKDNWDKNKTPGDLVVKDLFYINENCEEFKEALKDGNTIDLTFKVGVDAATFITAMVYVDGKWVPVDNCINNGDGTVTVTFSQICPVAFLVPGSSIEMNTVSPATSDVSGAILWGTVMVLSLAAIAVLVIYRRRVNG